MASTALELRPALLSHARELTGRRADLEADDLVSSAYLAMVVNPPDPQTLAQLNDWLRVVMRNVNARRHRNMHGATVVSYEAIQQARARGLADE